MQLTTIPTDDGQRIEYKSGKIAGHIVYKTDSIIPNGLRWEASPANHTGTPWHSVLYFARLESAQYYILACATDAGEL